MRVRLLVPRRDDGGHRDRLWAYCRAYWKRQRPDWEIVEGCHFDGPFNRSAGINAAAEGNWDVGVILDADTVLEPGLIDAGIERAFHTGRLTLPYKDRNLLSKLGTKQILRGFEGNWEQFVQFRQAPDDAYEFISAAQIVPRALWDEVGGFDERFEGWGGEDDAFHAACLAVRGQDPREDRLDGTCWHLWHEASRHASHKTPTWRAAKALSDRYIEAGEDWNVMRALLAEDRGSDQAVVLVLTTGKRESLADTVASIDENLTGPIGRKVIAVDDEDTDLAFPGWEVCPMGTPRGFAVATRHAHEVAIASGQPWVFWSEDDFTLNEPVDLRDLQHVMDAHPELVQLSLLRQPWYENEIEAGGVVEAKPHAFAQRDGYVEHRAYWTTNPMLTRRMFLAANEWPKGANSELHFAKHIFRGADQVGGILGALGDSPRCHHHGEERAGHGY